MTFELGEAVSRLISRPKGLLAKANLQKAE
jgi:hypothetical protein